jgi:hypothetical protein
VLLWSQDVKVSGLEEHPRFVEGMGVGKQEVRAEGWHVGGVLRGIAVEAGLYKESKNQTVQVHDGPIELNEKMFAGLAIEQYLVRRIPSISGTVWQPGESVIEGWEKGSGEGCSVYMNPDGWSPEVRWEGVGKWRGKSVAVLEEFKCTWKSSKREVRDEWMWLHQCGVYSVGMGTRWNRLWVFHVNGGYEKGVVGETVLRCHWIEWEEWELERMWEMVRKWVGGRKYGGET